MADWPTRSTPKILNTMLEDGQVREPLRGVERPTEPLRPCTDFHKAKKLDP